MLRTIEKLATVGKRIKTSQDILRVPHLRINVGIRGDKSEIMIYKAGNDPNPLEAIDADLYNSIHDLLEGYIFNLEQLAKKFVNDVTEE